MTGDAGDRETSSRTRRPGQLVLVAVAVLLLLGGGTAIAVGIADQDADPPAPSATSAETSRVTDGAVPGPRSDAPGSAPPPPAGETAPATPVAMPIAVRIPAIEVQSELITVGLNPDGTLEVPQPGPDYDKAAWFRESPRPGETGPAVIEGHVDSAANGPSVFYDLGRLVPGDRVEVDREDGSTATFEVYDVQTFPKDDFPTLAVYGNTDGSELRLITCGGPFDSEARSYEDNVVVFAALTDTSTA
jgi:sortase (surface protein transpeptidase)